MEKISQSIVSNFFNKKEDDDQRAVLVFGVQRFLEDVTKIIVITVLSIFLHIVKEICLVFATMLVYKNFVGGAHAKDNWICILFTTIFCFLPIYFTKYICLNNICLIILTILNLIFSAIVIIKIAPADTKNVPIINKNQRLKLKIGAVVALLGITIVLGLVIRNPYYYQIALICLIISNLNTTPVMYKFFKCEYSGGKID